MKDICFSSSSLFYFCGISSRFFESFFISAFIIFSLFHPKEILEHSRNKSSDYIFTFSKQKNFFKDKNLHAQNKK